MFREDHIICTNVLVLWKLGEYCVRLLFVRFLNSHQKTFFVTEHRLDFVVFHGLQVFRVDEHVAAAIQFHLTVHLSTAAQSK